jgi:hypothetical protein
MAFAQIPSSTPSGMGEWLVGFAAAVGIIVLILTGMNQWKQFMRPARKVRRAFAERFVTKAELKQAVETLTEQMTRYETTLGAALSKHEDYTHRRLHELSNAVNNVTLKVAEQTALMRELVIEGLKPICAKVDRLAVTTTAIAVRLQLPVQVDGIRAMTPDQEG